MKLIFTYDELATIKESIKNTQDRIENTSEEHIYDKSGKLMELKLIDAKIVLYLNYLSKGV